MIFPAALKKMQLHFVRSLIFFKKHSKEIK